MKKIMVLMIVLLATGCATVTKDLARTLRYADGNVVGDDDDDDGVGDDVVRLLKTVVPDSKTLLKNHCTTLIMIGQRWLLDRVHNQTRGGNLKL